MNNEHEEKALVALLAKGLLPEAQEELSDVQTEEIMKGSAILSEEDRAMLAEFNPLAFRGKSSSAAGRTIDFPTVQDDLPRAVGFYRKGHMDSSDSALNEALERKRKEIVDRRRREKDQQGVTDK